MEPSEQSFSRIERILASMVAGVIGVSILCFFAVLIGSWTGQGAAQANGDGIWRFVIMFPYFGLPAGMILLIALVVASSIRRAREGRARG